MANMLLEEEVREKDKEVERIPRFQRESAWEGAELVCIYLATHCVQGGACKLDIKICKSEAKGWIWVGKINLGSIATKWHEGMEMDISQKKGYKVEREKS